MNQTRSDAIDRRSLLLAGAGSALAVSAAAPLIAQPPGRPNILWLVSEDNNPYIGAYGDKLAHTPNIDGLARRGIRFRNAYSTVPVCAPSRFSILTGVPPVSCAPAQHMRATAKLPKGFRTYPELMRQAGYFCINNPKTDYNCDVDPKAIWDIQGIEGHWRKAPRDRPFLCVLNTGTSHEQQICGDTPGRVKPSDVRIPAFLPDRPEIREDYADYYNVIEQMDGEIGRWLAQLQADGLADDTIIFYYGDNGGVLPRSKRYCYDEGLRIPLIVCIPPKWRHLAPAAPGTVLDAPVTLMDLPATLLSIAGIAQPAQMTGKPLVGKRIGMAQSLVFGSRDRMDERYDLVRTVTDGRWRYIRNYMPHRPWGQHIGFEWQMQASYREWHALHLEGKLSSVQDRFFQPKPFEELYDLKADPDQVSNRIGDARAARIATRLGAALDRHILATNDAGFLSEGAPGEGYFEQRDRKAYPLPTLMVLGASAARRQARNVSRFQALLKSPAAAIRYWAALGLLMLGKDAASARPDLETVLRTDPLAQVRIVAAESLVVIGDPAEAVAILAGLADDPHPLPVRMQAFNALTCIGQAALPALPVIRKAARRPGQFDYLARLGGYLEAVLTGSYDPRADAMSAEACAAFNRGAPAFMGPAPGARWTS